MATEMPAATMEIQFELRRADGAQWALYAGTPTRNARILFTPPVSAATLLEPEVWTPSGCWAPVGPPCWAEQLPDDWLFAELAQELDDVPLVFSWYELAGRA